MNPRRDVMRFFCEVVGCAALSLVAGCGPNVTSDATSTDAGSSTTGDGTTDRPSTVTDTNSTTGVPPNPTMPPEPDPVTSTGALDGSGTSEPILDFGSLDECNPWEQNCPPGYKCMPYANDGGNAWNDAKCTPLDPEPDAQGEPCTAVESGVSGIDSCDEGLICWDLNERNEGVCETLCAGSYDNPQCPDDHVCSAGGDGFLALCIPTCHPLDQSTCAKGEGCYPSNDAFVCGPEVGQFGELGNPCEFVNACEQGLLCAPVASICEDENATGCCLPYCDLDEPSCPEPLECLTFFESGTPAPGYEDVGYCADPTQ